MAMNKKLEESYEGAAAVVRRAPRASHLDRELPLAYPDLGRAMYALIRGDPLDDPRSASERTPRATYGDDWQRTRIRRRAPAT